MGDVPVRRREPVSLCEMEELRAESARSVWYTELSRARSALVLVVRDREGSLADRSIGEVLDAVIPRD